VFIFIHRIGFGAGRRKSLRLFVLFTHLSGWRNFLRQEISRTTNCFKNCFTIRQIGAAFFRTCHPGGSTFYRWVVRSGFSPVRPPVSAFASPGPRLF
jgi:hypothetical protein